MKKFLLFDNDGVLVDTEQYYYRASKEVLEENGYTFSEEDFVTYSLTKGVGVWNALPQLSKDKIRIMRDKRDELYHSYLKNKKIDIDGVKEVLDELSTKYRMAIVTSALRDDFLAIHKRTGFLKYFEFFLANGDYKASKPDPSPYLTALEKFSAKKSDAIIIEDTIRGIISGNRAKIETIAIPNKMIKNVDGFSTATYKIENIKDLPKLLKEI